ncbi:hypothetical protein T07_9873 [Trichinella nelsoni]|uniref:Uncharacterized protein n=1 Tax=Trichinella nelsoni TaxID=6336 RepID=A0A0V0RPS6_9BILA|nr:hypothetical protein T07_9873 [Trichinella nelsoni]
MWSSVYSNGSQNPLDCDPFLKLQDRAKDGLLSGCRNMTHGPGAVCTDFDAFTPVQTLFFINPSSVLICLPRKPRATLENH